MVFVYLTQNGFRNLCDQFCYLVEDYSIALMIMLQNVKKYYMC